MNTTDIIQLVLAIVTAITSIISILIANKTLKQNSKMIEESTRPYVIIYSAVTNYEIPLYKLIVKNTGTSSATITKFKPGIDLSTLCLGKPKSTEIFTYMEGTFIAPGQSYVTTLDYEKIKNLKEDRINFAISYKSSPGKTYIESTELDIKSQLGGIDNSKNAPKNEMESLKIIGYALQDHFDKEL